MQMNVLEYGWLASERDERGDRKPGSMGVLFGISGKVGRKKLHPKAGHLKQYLERDKLLAEIRKITGLHPFFYAKYNHMPFVYRNVIEPYLPES